MSTHPRTGKQISAEITAYCDHIIFNSFAQYNTYKKEIKDYKEKNIECGIRVNPEYSEIRTAIYDPCDTHSRLGVTEGGFNKACLDGIDGLHFHTMCEQNSDTLERTIRVGRREVRSVPASDEMDKLRRRAPHHEGRLRY